MSLPHARKRPLHTGFVKERTPHLPLERDPWMPPPYDNSDIVAFRALREGRADGYQQMRAMEWIVFASGTYENPFRPGGADGDRATNFAMGKQFVGQQIVKLMNLPVRNDKQGEQD